MGNFPSKVENLWEAVEKAARKWQGTDNFRLPAILRILQAFFQSSEKPDAHKSAETAIGLSVMAATVADQGQRTHFWE